MYFAFGLVHIRSRYPILFTLDIHQKKNTRLKPSYLFKDPVTKRQTKVICIFRVQISHKTHFTSKYVCFPSHCESLVATLRGQAWKLLWVYRSHCASSNFGLCDGAFSQVTWHYQVLQVVMIKWDRENTCRYMNDAKWQRLARAERQSCQM